MTRGIDRHWSSDIGTITPNLPKSRVCVACRCHQAQLAVGVYVSTLVWWVCSLPRPVDRGRERWGVARVGRKKLGLIRPVPE